MAVIASFLAFLFLLDRKLALLALIGQAFTLYSCFVTVLAAADEVSTPISTPSFFICIGMSMATARFVKTAAALHIGTTKFFSEMSSLRAIVQSLKSLAHLKALPLSYPWDFLLTRFEMSSTCRHKVVSG